MTVLTDLRHAVPAEENFVLLLTTVTGAEPSDQPLCSR